MIKVEHLKKVYGTKTAVNDISFDVKKGEIFGFLGPNGAGKTTTMKILTGQLLPSYGEASVMGMDVTKMKAEVKSGIGVVPENANLYERLTVEQNLKFFCGLYGCDTGNIDNYLEAVSLLKEKGTQVKKLSKGMKQRVLLVRALLHNPKILMLDEPTSGLDPSSADEIHCLLRKLNSEGMTIMLTSHNMEEVNKLCDRTAFLNSGSIAELGTPEELKLKYADRKVKVLLDGRNSLEQKVVGLDSEESAGLIAGWIREGRLRSIHSCEPTLAEIFMKVTGREFR
jgi:ABC-2 type transport system ATP-binding protein